MDDEALITPTSEREGERLEDGALRSAFGFDQPDDQWLEILRESKSTMALGRLGPYRLLGELGRGGQGSVYRAHRDGDEHPVALKRMPMIGGSEDAGARFEREREAIALLSHPCIVGIRRVEMIDGQPVLAMELVEGQPIDRWAGAIPGRPVGPILEVFLRVCDAVAHAHRRGVLHRDLKPSNILVDERGGPRVLDFGLAKLTEPSEGWGGGAGGLGRGEVDSFVTRASGFVGTPAYAAPEQLGGDQRRVDTRCDVYALGVLLYTLLTGELPFNAKAPLAELFDQIRVGIGRSPSAARPGLGRELDAITLKAAAVEPERRYASVDDLAADLRRYLAGQTVLAHPPTAAYKLSKVWQRHRIIAPILVAAGIGVVGLSVVSTALALGLRAQRDRLADVSQSELHARQVAEKALDESRKQTDRHQAAAQFLADMLGGVHDSYQRGLPLGSREMIDRAARRLDAGELSNQPEVEVALLYALGRAYGDLGHLREAEVYLLRALERSTAHYGPDHAETGRCIYACGLVEERKAHVSEAIRLYSQAREVITRAAGEKDAVGAQIDNNLGCVLRMAGRFEESEVAHRKALAIRLEMRGEHHPEIAESYRNLGLTLAKLRRFDEAHRVIDKTIALCEELFGPENDKTIIARIYRTRVYQEEKRFEEALELRRECLRAAVAAHGENHVFTGVMHHYIELSLTALGRSEEAIEHARAYRESIRLTGEDPAGTMVGTSCEISEALGKLSRFDEARAELEAARADVELAPAEDREELLQRIESAMAKLKAREAGAHSAGAGAPPAPTGAAEPAPVRKPETDQRPPATSVP